MTVNTVIAGAATCTAPYAPTQQSFAATNFLTTQSTNGRTLSARFADFLNVMDYGATGNGSNDDTAAIQACIDKLASTTTWGTVYFPATANFYKITSALQFSNGTSSKGIVFRGDGLASIIKGTVTAPTAFITLVHAAGTVTGTTGSPHGLPNGTNVEITIASATGDTAVNGTWNSTITGASTLTYAVAGSGTPGGSPTYAVTALGWCFASYKTTGNNGPSVFENLNIQNLSQAVFTGAIYNSTTIALTVNHCLLSGFQVVNVINAGASGTMSNGFYHNVFTCSASLVIGNLSYAMALGNGHVAIGNDMNGFDTGIRLTNKAQVVSGGRIETSGTAIDVGIDDVGSLIQAEDFYIAGVSMEAINKGVNVRGGNGVILCCDPAGSANSPGGIGITGLDLTGMSSGLVASCGPGGQFSTAAMVVPSNNDGQGTNLVFAGCLPNNSGGSNTVWSGGTGQVYLNCNEGTAQHIVTFSHRPTVSPAIGQEVWFSDANSSTAFSTISGGGSTHVIGKWNGTNWIVVGVY